jgi:hypothetical protein
LFFLNGGKRVPKITTPDVYNPRTLRAEHQPDEQVTRCRKPNAASWDKAVVFTRHSERQHLSEVDVQPTANHVIDRQE